MGGYMLPCSECGFDEDECICGLDSDTDDSLWPCDGHDERIEARIICEDCPLPHEVERTGKCFDCIGTEDAIEKL